MGKLGSKLAKKAGSTFGKRSGEQLRKAGQQVWKAYYEGSLRESELGKQCREANEEIKLGKQMRKQIIKQLRKAM